MEERHKEKNPTFKFVTYAWDHISGHCAEVLCNLLVLI